jgi:S-adenosylmethionine:tRNA ribosyltransferase-isomerase
VILSGTHEPGTSHYELLRAFTDDATLGLADDELKANNYRTHEFGDSVLIEKTSVERLQSSNTLKYNEWHSRPPRTRIRLSARSSSAS